jgi:hypothetical protein
MQDDDGGRRMKNKYYRFYKKILKNMDLITGRNKKLEERILMSSLEVICASAKWNCNQKDLVISKEICNRLNKLGYEIDLGDI